MAKDNQHFKKESVERMTHTADDRLPRGPWRHTYFLAIALFLLLLTGWELFLRANGHKPQLTDDADLWAQARRTVPLNDKNAVVLIGGSRSQVGFNTSVFEAETGIKPVQLSINGSSGIPEVLEELANNESFSGTVIADVASMYILRVPQAGAKAVAPDPGDTAVQFVKHYEEQNAFGIFEYELKQAVQRSFVSRRGDLTPLQIVQPRRLMAPKYNLLNDDRSRNSDFKLLSPQELRDLSHTWDHFYNGDAPPVSDFLKSVKTLDGITRKLQSHGGQVIFVCFPTTHPLEAKKFPKKLYWDNFAKNISAPTIHFKDYPQLASFKCPDDSHLDYRDTPAFTKGLIEAIRAQDSAPAWAKKSNM